MMDGENKQQVSLNKERDIVKTQAELRPTTFSNKKTIAQDRHFEQSPANTPKNRAPGTHHIPLHSSSPPVPHPPPTIPTNTLPAPKPPPPAPTMRAPMHHNHHLIAIVVIIPTS